MRIAFVSLNRTTLRWPVLPLGVLTVMANTPERHEREFWDLRFAQDPEDPLAYLEERVRAFRPDVAAVGLRNLMEQDCIDPRALLDRPRRIIAHLKRITAAPIVLGGSGFSVLPRELMRHLEPHYGLAGEAERSFPRLLEELEKEKGRPGAGDFASIARLHYFAGGELRSTVADELPVVLDEVRFPDLAAADPRYLRETGLAALQTKRGCAQLCSYCSYPSIEGRAIRRRSAEGAVEEMIALSARLPEIRRFFIVDSVFNHPKSHALEFCREKVRRGFAMPWICYVNPLGFDEELASAMVEAGCESIEIGSDSGSESMLRRLRKGFTTEDIRRLARICRRVGLSDDHSFLLGSPGEMLEEARETLRFVRELEGSKVSLYLWADDRATVSAEVDVEALVRRSAFKKLVTEEGGAAPPWHLFG